MLEININLPEIEEPKTRLSSAIVVPAGSKELAVDSSVANERKSNVGALFPHSPRKALQANWAVRKPTHKGRHSSNIPRALTHTNARLEFVQPKKSNALVSSRFPAGASGVSLNKRQRTQESQRNLSR